MFFESMFTMLHKENLDQYLLNTVPLLRHNPQRKLSPMIAQVLSNQLITDGNTNFVCRFRKPVKRGSIVRLVEWNLQLQNFVIVIDDHQYLGGEGYAIIRQGQPWDIEKIKLISNSNVVANSFVILYAPTTVDCNSQRNGAKNVKNKEKYECEETTNAEQKSKSIHRNDNAQKNGKNCNEDSLLKVFRGQIQKVYSPYFTLNSSVQNKESFKKIRNTNSQNAIKNANAMNVGQSKCRQIRCEQKNIQQDRSQKNSSDEIIEKLQNIQKLLKCNIDDDERNEFENEKQTQHQNGEVGSSTIEEQQQQRKLVFTQLDIQKAKKQKVRNDKLQQKCSFAGLHNNCTLSQLPQQNSATLKHKSNSLTFDKIEIQKLLGKGE